MFKRKGECKIKNMNVKCVPKSDAKVFHFSAESKFSSHANMYINTNIKYSKHVFHAASTSLNDASKCNKGMIPFNSVQQKMHKFYL